MKLYKNQSSLTITQNTGVDVASSSSRVIKYKKPDGTIGEWESTIVDTMQIRYSFTGTELDMVGKWVRWSFVTFADGRTAPGKPIEFVVSEEGT